MKKEKKHKITFSMINISQGTQETRATGLRLHPMATERQAVQPLQRYGAGTELTDKLSELIESQELG